MKKDFVFTILLLIAVIWTAALIPVRSLAYSTTSDSTSLSAPSIIDPLDVLKNSLLKNAIPNVGNFSIGTIIPNISLDLSSNDLAGALKAVIVFAINLFLIVIQTVAGILKALLPFLGR